MWLADDDYIDADYVASCVHFLETDPQTSMAYGASLIEFVEDGQTHSPTNVDLDMDSADDRVTQYFENVCWNGMYYGIYRTELIQNLKMPPFAMGSDWLMVAAIAWLGKVRCARDTIFHQSARKTDSLQAMAKRLGLCPLQGEATQLSIALSAHNEIAWKNPTYSNASPDERLRLGKRVFETIIKRFGDQIVSAPDFLLNILSHEVGTNIPPPQGVEEVENQDSVTPHAWALTASFAPNAEEKVTRLRWLLFQTADLILPAFVRHLKNKGLVLENEKLDTVNATKSAYQVHIDTLSDQISGLYLDRDNLYKERAVLYEERATLYEDRTQLTAERTQLTDERTQLTAERDQLRIEVEEWRDRHQKLESLSQEKISKFTKKASLDKEDRKKLKKQLDTLQKFKRRLIHDFSLPGDAPRSLRRGVGLARFFRKIFGR